MPEVFRVDNRMGGPDCRAVQAEQGAAGPHEVPHHTQTDCHQVTIFYSSCPLHSVWYPVIDLAIADPNGNVSKK